MKTQQERPSVEEFFDSLGHGHPAVVSSDKFNKLIAVYELTWGNLPTVFDEDKGESVKCCPVTGEELRRTKAYLNNFITKDISEVKLYDEIEEMSKMNTHKTIVTEHTIELLALLHKAQSECLHKLIHSLVQYNQGHVRIEDEEELRRFKKAVKVLENMKVVKRIKNNIRRKNDYSFQIAPHLAYKGSEAMREASCQSWIRDQAKERAKDLFK
jgi:hypothetical protein